jgi:simple sugar transport system ATP-binding protein
LNGTSGSGTKTGSPVIQLEKITKRFHRLVANDQVTIDIYPGEVLGLLGENGAGKTTLMNVLYGLYQPEEGKIWVDGVPVQITSPQEAIHHGIGMVHQHFMLVRTFTVAENLALGLRQSRSPLLTIDKVAGRLQELSEAFHIPVDPQALVWKLSVGEQQRVEILNALFREARVLIFDEPTAVLTPQETEALFATFRLLIGQNKAVVFITHKLDEALAITDRIAVLRQGHLVGVRPTQEMTERELAKMMVGREVLFDFTRQAQKTGAVGMSAKDLWVRGDKGLPAVKGLSLSIHGGEILGIAGVDGNGQRELCEALVGLRPIESGQVVLGGLTFSSLTPRQVIEKGVGYIPEDRQRTGLVLNFPVWRNAILKSYRLSQFCRVLFLRFQEIMAFTRDLIKQYDIRVPHEKVLVNTLSGGNQQKLVLARELSSNPEILIANQPTRGLDIASIEYVHSQLVQQRDKGKAVLLVSRELREVMSLSDRIAVMYKGQIVGSMTAREASVERIGALMLGITSGETP